MAHENETVADVIAKSNILLVKFNNYNRLRLGNLRSSSVFQAEAIMLVQTFELPKVELVRV
jgi:hypothetical protein